MVLCPVLSRKNDTKGKAMDKELRVYNKRIELHDSGQNPYSFMITADDNTPHLIDGSTLDEVLDLIESALSNYPLDEAVTVEDLVSGAVLRGAAGRVRGFARARVLHLYMLK